MNTLPIEPVGRAPFRRSILPELLAVESLGATALAVAVVADTVWTMAAAIVWLFALFVGVLSAGGRSVSRGRSFVRSTGLLVLTCSLVFLASWFVQLKDEIYLSMMMIFVAVAASMAAVAWGVGLLPLALLRAVRRRTSPIPAPAKSWSLVTVAVAAGVSLLAFSVPPASALLVRQNLTGQIASCPDLASLASESPVAELHGFVDACRGRAAGDVLRSEAAGIALEVYEGPYSADTETVTEFAESALEHMVGLLGPPATDTITVTPTDGYGSYRGMAGPGFVFLDYPEARSPDDCQEFRASRGEDGTCGSWVIAHEVAHQWLPGLAEASNGRDRVAWEAAADYLAWDWWRATYGPAEAQGMVEDLIAARLELAGGYAASHLPAEPALSLDSSRERSLVYGRGSAGWVAADLQAGRAAVMKVIKRISQEASKGYLSVDSVLRAARSESPPVAKVLQQWWEDGAFEPVMPEV